MQALLLLDLQPWIHHQLETITYTAPADLQAMYQFQKLDIVSVFPPIDITLFSITDNSNKSYAKAGER